MNWLPAAAADSVGIPDADFWVIVGRIEIGIMAINDSVGSSSLSSRYARIAPPMTATPMSLIFASGMPLRISFSVSIVVYDVPTTRCGPTVWLNRVPCGNDAGDVTSGFLLSRASAR